MHGRRPANAASSSRAVQEECSQRLQACKAAKAAAAAARAEAEQAAAAQQRARGACDAVRAVLRALQDNVRIAPAGPS